MPHPFLIPELPAAAVGPTVQESTLVAGRLLHWLRPAAPERLLDLASVADAYGEDEYLPYWATVWPASRYLMEAILQSSWAAGCRALELGCGLGLGGVAGLAAGWHVTFSDYDQTALRFAALNARLNGFADFTAVALDWRRPLPETFDVIIASDVIYERRSINPLLRALSSMLKPDGTALIADPNRPYTEEFRRRLGEHGFKFAPQPWPQAPQAGQLTATVYRIQWAK